MRITVIFISISLFLLSAYSQTTKNMAEKLGYDRNAKLLIIHVDDIGLSHATNSAAIQIFSKQNFSGSMMIPCPWFPEFAEYAKNNPKMDIGIHITLTSEWDNYFFGGILNSTTVPTLVNTHGYFYPSTTEFAANQKLKEVELEIKAQIDRAISYGIKPTHLDSHMFSMFATQELVTLFLKIGKEYKLPVFLPLNRLSSFSDKFVNQIKENNIVIENFFFKEKSSPKNEWGNDYNEFIENMKPGLSEIIIHPAFDTDENRAIMVNHKDFGSEWRQNDFDYIMSEEFQKIIDKNNIKIVTWRQITEFYQ